MKAIDVIEPAKSYYLLSNDKKSKPVLVGNRVQLEFALQDIESDMIIATSGNDKRCLILIDYPGDKVWALTRRAENKLLKIKARN